MRAPRSGIIAGTIVLLAVLVGAIPAAAATTTSWATWGALAGTGGAYTTTVQIAQSPAVTATMTSDSRAGQVGVISGASTWLSQGTPVGAKYGTSVDQPYLNLRPKTDTATGASTTTYSFATPTPSSGWTFVLGDIDADAVRIQAIGVNGQTLSAADLGFQGGFNYCAPGVVGKPSCTGSASDVPTWDPTTLTLTGNPAAADTAGAAAWFEPSVPIVSLTFFFTRRAGFPIYQTWFASIARDITGTVVDAADGPLEGVTLTLTDANGTVVGTTTTAAGGTYAFPGFVATDGYTVRVAPPAGKVAETAIAVPVDLTDADGVANFTVRAIEPVAVSGRVVIDGTTTPVPGATVTIGALTTTTDANGFYLFDRVEVGAYTAIVTPPAGYSTANPAQPVVVPPNSEVPIENVDFALVENADLSGTVRAGAAGVAGVVVTASVPDGPTFTAVTNGGGDYAFPRIPAGTYDVTVTTPDGYVAAGPVTRSETLVTSDIVDVDFDLARPGSIDGVVRGDGGAPADGVVVTIAGDGGSEQLTTAADGSYSIGDLTPGTYTATVTAPSGSTVVGAATRTIVITAAGEAFVDQDFSLAAVAVPPTTTPTSPSPSPDPGTGSATGGTLPSTGLAPETFAWAAAGGAVLVLGAVLLVVSRRRSRRD